MKHLLRAHRTGTPVFKGGIIRCAHPFGAIVAGSDVRRVLGSNLRGLFIAL